MHANRWRAKSAFVCGASAGLGRELALRLAAQDIAKLGLLARRLDALTELEQEIRQRFPAVEVEVFQADLGCSDTLQELAGSVEARIGHLDLLINAIGQSDRGKISGLEVQKMHDLLHANVATSLNAIQGFRRFLQPRAGTIVLIGSLASLFAPRFLGGYAIAKHALAALAQQARLELAEDGIHVMLACPGPIQRSDGGQRYATLANDELPGESLQPGGGAKLKGLHPIELADDILVAADKRKCTLIRPWSARLLHTLNTISPGLAEYILRRRTQ